MIVYPETSSFVPIEWLEFLNFGGLAWEKPRIAASPVFSLFYHVLIPTYFENLGHLQLEGFQSSKFLSKILVAKKKKGFFFCNQDFGKEWLKQILKYFVLNML